MRTLAKVLAAVVVLALIVMGGSYLYVAKADLARYQRLANVRIEALTGRTLHIDGAFRVTPSLRPKIVAEKIRFSNAEGLAEAEMAQAARIQAQVELLPLLKGELRLASMVLEKPRLLLETDKEGHANWQFLPVDKGEEARAEAEVSSLRFLAQVGEVRIEDGELLYHPYGGEVQTIQLRRATLKGGDANAPLHIEVDGRWHNDPIHISAQTGTVAQLTSDRHDVSLKAHIAAFNSTADIAGRIKDALLDADVTFAIVDPKPVMSRFVPALSDLKGPVNGTAHVRGNLVDATFEKLALKAGSSDLAGTVRLVRTGERLKLTGDVTSQRIALVDFGVRETATSPPPARAAEAPPPERTRLIPDTPIDVTFLRLADADVKASIGMLRIPNFEFHDIAGAFIIAKGVFDTNLTRVSLAGGQFNAVAHLDATKDMPTARLKLQGHDFPIAFFLRGSWANAIEGLVSVDVDLESAGRSPAEMAANMNGYGNLLMGEGRAHIRGLEAMVGGIGTALGTLFAGNDEWSVVNCSALRFVVKKGVGAGEVILFDSRYATVGGEGTIDFDNETLDLIITPRSKAAVTLNVSAPVRIHGTFLNPSFTPDSFGVLRKVVGIAGVFLFPPAAVIGLVELGGNTNACADIARQGIAALERRQGPVPPGNEQVMPPVTPVPDVVGRALDNLDQGIRNLFGVGREAPPQR